MMTVALKYGQLLSSETQNIIITFNVLEIGQIINLELYKCFRMINYSKKNV